MPDRLIAGFPDRVRGEGRVRGLQLLQAGDVGRRLAEPLEQARQPAVDPVHVEGGDPHRACAPVRYTIVRLTESRPSTPTLPASVSRPVVSCGILIVDHDDELLLCHATGTSRWDIPKGRREPGESEQDAAIRETFEETGLRFEPQALLELGRFRYRPGKDLHLFATRIER